MPFAVRLGRANGISGVGIILRVGIKVIRRAGLRRNADIGIAAARSVPKRQNICCSGFNPYRTAVFIHGKRLRGLIIVPAGGGITEP